MLSWCSPGFVLPLSQTELQTCWWVHPEPERAAACPARLWRRRATSHSWCSGGTGALGTLHLLHTEDRVISQIGHFYLFISLSWQLLLNTFINDKRGSSLGSGLPVLHCLDAINLKINQQHETWNRDVTLKLGWLTTAHSLMTGTSWVPRSSQ